MADRAPSNLLQYLRYVTGVWKDDARTDAELLDQFASDRDEGAFAALVGRHGRTVWRSCAAKLGTGPDAEDAFQAVFLALARKARGVRAESLPAWLQKVAQDAVRQTTRASHRRDRHREQFAAATRPDTADDFGVRAVVDADTRAAVEEELSRLIERYRVPLVLYYMEGKTQADVARVLGVSDRVVRERLDHGVKVIRRRLANRGLVVSSAVIAAVLGPDLGPAFAVSAKLAVTTIEAAARFAADPAAAAGPAAQIALGLGGGGKAWALGAAAAAVAAAGTVGFAVSVDRAVLSPAEVKPIASAQAGRDRDTDARPPQGLAARPALDPAPGTFVAGRVTGPDGTPARFASVAALARQPFGPGSHSLHDAVVARGTADADGRFRLAVPVAQLPSWGREPAVTVVASLPGLAPMSRTVSLRDAAAADLGLTAARTVTGQLLGMGGPPAIGARVAVVRLGAAVREDNEDDEIPPGWPDDSVAGPDGRFTLPGLPPGPVWVEVRDPRFARQTVRLPENGEAIVALAPARVLAGRVTSNGRPVAAKLTVFCGPWAAHHDRYTVHTAAPDRAADAAPLELDGACGPDGTFRLSLPPVGPYRVAVVPPAGEPSLGVVRTLEWNDWEAERTLDVALPAGVEVAGTVKDDAGKPVPGAVVWYTASSTNKLATTDLLTGRDAATRAGPDGTFRVVALPGKGKGKVEAFGPTPDYQPATFDLLKCSACGKAHIRRFEHASVRIEADAGKTPASVAVTLRRGEAVAGRAVGPDGRPIRDGVLIARAVVQPLRNLVPRPLPVRDGDFALPGCVPGRVYPVLLLDPADRVGALVELRVPAAGEPPPVVKLLPCGSAELRAVDRAGRPRAGWRAGVSVRLGCDHPATLWPRECRAAGPVEASWFDPRDYLVGPATDADGRVALPALVPGAEMVPWAEEPGGGRRWYGKGFSVAPGATLRLPDLVTRAEAADEPLPAREP